MNRTGDVVRNAARRKRRARIDATIFLICGCSRTARSPGSDATRLELRPAGVTVASVHPVIFRTPMIGDALGSPAAVELVRDFTGVFKTATIEDVVADMVAGIERRSKRIVSPRPHHVTALVPGLAQAALERLAFRPRTIRRAVELGAVPAPPRAAPTASQDDPATLAATK